MSATLVSIDPATGKEIKAYPVHDDKKVDYDLKLALKCFETWRKEPINKRGVLLKRIAAELRKEKDELALLATTEMGKPIQQSRDEVEKCAMVLEFYANEGPKFLANEIIPTDAHKSYVSFQPMGIVLAIMPWNFPYWQVFRAMAPATMAGNVMLL